METSTLARGVLDGTKDGLRPSLGRRMKEGIRIMFLISERRKEGKVVSSNVLFYYLVSKE